MVTNEEYLYIVEKSLYGFLKRSDEQKIQSVRINNKKDMFFIEKNYLFIRGVTGSEFFKLEIEKGADKGLLKQMVFYLNKQTKTTKEVKYINLKDLIIKDSIKKGLMIWLFSDNINQQLHDKEDKCFQYLKRIEDIIWYTYEGNNITKIFAFVDYENHDKGIDILNFLNSKYVLPLAKEKYSAILIDKRTFKVKEFAGHGKSSILDLDSYSMPLDFVSVINEINTVHNNETNNSKIYFIINEYREILIVKYKRIFATIKGNNCQFFNYFKLKTTLYKTLKSNCDVVLINSLIDVSYAKTGGILCILDDNISQIKKIDDVIQEIDRFDHMVNFDSYSSEKIDKRRCLLQMLEKYKECNTFNFYRMDRNLRKDLLSLDGALIIKKDGTLVAVGAIIKKVSLSSGGGRSSATKELSKYGLAFKISADGEIDVYRKSKLI